MSNNYNIVPDKHNINPLDENKSGVDFNLTGKKFKIEGLVYLHDGFADNAWVANVLLKLEGFDYIVNQIEKQTFSDAFGN